MWQGWQAFFLTRRLLLFCAPLAMVIGYAGIGHAATRVALVVGISAYKHTTPLENPSNDATDIAAVLRASKFDVTVAFDLTKSQFDETLLAFSRRVQGAEVALFYFAGHGLQVNGTNYLVPADAKAEALESLDWELIRLDQVLRTVERASSTNIVFLDACRNNPLARSLARTLGTRSSSVGSGLASIESGVGTLISFSTQPGNVALDGAGRNSPFAAALVRQIATAKDLSTILIDVRNEVRTETGGKQVPWEHSALTRQFYFSNTTTETAPNARRNKGGQISAAERAWASVAKSERSVELKLFALRHRGTLYGDLAEARLNELLQRPNAPKSQFDGKWIIVRQTKNTCPRRIAPELALHVVAGNAVGLLGDAIIQGTIAPSGSLEFTHASVDSTGRITSGDQVLYKGRIVDGIGRGTFGVTASSRCGGEFSLIPQ